MSDSPELYPRQARSRPLLLLIGVGLAIAAVILVLTMGGRATRSDAAGDARLIEGRQPKAAADIPIAAAVADIVGAEVSSRGANLVFRVRTAGPIPETFERSSLEFRFDITGQEGNGWILSSTVNVSPTAALVSATSDYTSTTIDGSFPGEVDVSGRTVTITLDPTRVDGLAESFEWSLSSKLIAYRDWPRSAGAEDRYPDEGTIAGP
ncbi:MAG: hypothetical protein ACRDKT_11330 [Actinomycetota bacterium]